MRQRTGKWLGSEMLGTCVASISQFWSSLRRRLFASQEHKESPTGQEQDFLHSLGQSHPELRP